MDQIRIKLKKLKLSYSKILKGISEQLDFWFPPPCWGSTRFIAISLIIGLLLHQHDWLAFPSWVKKYNFLEISPIEAKFFDRRYHCSPELNSITEYWSVFPFIIENVPANLDIYLELNNIEETLCIGVPIKISEIDNEFPKHGSIFNLDLTISPTFKFCGVRTQMLCLWNQILKTYMRFY